MVVGGIDVHARHLSDVQVIYITNKTITSVSTAPSMPYPVGSATVTVDDAGKNMFVLGTNYFWENEYNDMVFDVKQQTWKTLPKLTRVSATSFMLNNIIYRVGGKWQITGENVNYAECIDIRNIKSGWKNCGSSYVPHTDRPVSCVMGEWAWVSGGITDESDFSAAVYHWQPGRKWETMADMIRGRVGHAMTSDGKLIYVIGGFYTNNEI